MEASAEERNTFSGEEYEYEEEEEEEFEEVEIEEEVEEEEEEEEDVEEGGPKEQDLVDKVEEDSAGHETTRIQHGGGSTSSEGKIFVGGVAWETTEENFTTHFKKYGKIIDSVIMKDRHTHTPRGFGFITFSDPAVLDDVLKDEHVIDGRSVEVKRTVPRETMVSKGGPKTKKIFVGGIPPSFTEDDFNEYFSAYGKVAEHQIMLDHSTGRSRGFGFITFENEDSVEEIMANDKQHELGGKVVELKRAVPKKPGGVSSSGRGGSYAPSGGNMYGGYGPVAAHGSRSGNTFAGRMAPAPYGRGYGYGGGYGYPMGFNPGYGGQMYGYGAGYGGQGGYGAFYGAGGAAYGSGRYGGRYNPYGR